ncbi:DHA1 family inner membrane transport protein [Rhizobium sp. SG_E_25_P2]|uniref:MFS transporter n=1 Tax=Rhizobium sp. SG_E_25_P2 TaxID=2879942 RepID=UPI002476B7BC|nr:MFS transporter [Rhizobium sp. SG_E_25_P2]MDH6264909.1 DHA1 family inner membrane transport protein [Rhizobium sp. SG_E_25_P2]
MQSGYRSALRRSLKTLLRSNLAPSMAVGSIGALSLGLQPVLLGGLFSEGRATFDEIAILATLEMLAIGLGSAMLSVIGGARSMRVKSFLLLGLAAAAHAATAFAPSPLWLILVRVFAGFVEGGLIAVAIELIARSQTPGRNGGWFIIVQTLAQSAAAAIIALLVAPAWGSTGSFLLLAAATLTGLLVAPRLLDDYGPLSPDAALHPTAVIALGPALALLSIFSLYMFTGAIWAFLEPLGAQNNVPSATVGLIVSVSLLAQVAGALAATALEPKIPYVGMLSFCALTAVGIAYAFTQGVSLPLFWLLSLAAGFLLLFVTPWQIAMTVAADSTRRTALLTPAAQLFGGALGPAGASFFVTGDDFRPIAVFAGASALVSLVLTLSFGLTRSRHRGV